MRGREDGSATLFSDMRLEERKPQDHPLRPIRALADEVLAGLLALKPVKRLPSSDHVSVDGTGEPPGTGRNGARDFRNETRSNETHVSTTDPDARLYRKGHGQESRLCFISQR